MATFTQSTVNKVSDSHTAFCSSCLEHKIDILAEVYCDNCLQFFCSKCITLHGQLFGKHVTHGRTDTSKWPVAKEVEDFLQKCDLHKDKRLEMFCEDHSQLCCTSCAFLYHRQCAKVTLISESVKGPPSDLQSLSRKIQTIIVELKQLQNNLNSNVQSLQVLNKQILHEIRQTRQTINLILDDIEKTTIKELDDKMTSLKASLLSDLENCSKLKNELNQLSGAINDIVDKGKLELSFIASKKCLEKIKHSETFLKGNSVQVQKSLTFQGDSDVQQYLTQLPGLGRIVLSTKASSVLGDQDQVFTLQEKSEYDVSTPGVLYKGFINAICVLSDDQIIVIDNYNIKLLNKHYQVVGQCRLIANDICKTSPNQVAVAEYYNNTHDVRFFSVINGQLKKGKKLQFQHYCQGIAHYRQNLYITTGTALYRYSMKGDLSNTLYEDKSGENSVYNCAVSPSGDKIFVTNNALKMVLTLDRDGKVLHTFADPDLLCPQYTCIQVTDIGLLLVCYSSSKTLIIQLDGEGKKKLATLASWSDGLSETWSVCYNKSTESIIVGQCREKLLVFKLK